MATKMVRRRNSNAGSQSASQLIVSKNRKLGVHGIGSQQSTSRTIYDAILLATTAGNSQIVLFQNCKQRAFPLTNLTENKLQVGESLIMQRYSFYVIQCTSATTNALDVAPLSFFSEFNRLYASTFDVQIGQDVVIKQQPLSSMYSVFNKDSKFNSIYQIQPPAGTLTSNEVSHDVAWFDSDIAIPPQVEFKVTLTVPPIGLPAGYDFYIAMKIEGLGSLFAPKSTF